MILSKKHVNVKNSIRFIFVIINIVICVHKHNLHRSSFGKVSKRNFQRTKIVEESYILAIKLKCNAKQVSDEKIKFIFDIFSLIHSDRAKPGRASP